MPKNEPNTRFIAMILDVRYDVDFDKLKELNPDWVEIYHIDVHTTAAQIEDEIDMALLNDLICPVRLAFVGEDLAKDFAKRYYGTWIADSPNAEEELLKFWEIR